MTEDESDAILKMYGVPCTDLTHFSELYCSIQDDVSFDDKSSYIALQQLIRVNYRMLGLSNIYSFDAALRDHMFGSKYTFLCKLLIEHLHKTFPHLAESEQRS